MKKLILLTVTTVLAHATANAENILAQVKGVDGVIKSVSLTDTGLLKIERNTNQEETLVLSKANATRLTSSAQMLGNLEIVTETRPVVCMMIFPFGMIFEKLSVANAKTGSLDAVLTPDSCALSTYVHPKYPYQIDEAKKLRDEMTALARQLE